jgi:hypothetical protein
MPFDPNRSAQIVEGIPEAPGESVQVAGTPKRVPIAPNVVPWDGGHRTPEEIEEWMRNECLSFAVQKRDFFCDRVEFKRRHVLAQCWSDVQEAYYQKIRLETAEFFHKFLTSDESDGLFFKQIILSMRKEGYSAEWRKEQFKKLFEGRELAYNELGVL